MNGLRCYKPHKLFTKARHSNRGTNPAALGGKSCFPNDRLGIKTVVSRAAVCQ